MDDEDDRLDRIKEALQRCFDGIAEGKQAVWEYDHEFRLQVERILLDKNRDYEVK